MTGEESIQGEYPARDGQAVSGESWDIRPLCREDVAAVALLEQKIFGMPWSVKTVEESVIRGQEMFPGGPLQSLSHAAFGAFLQQGANPEKQAFSKPGERLAGYVFAMAAAGEGELHRIAVDPTFRRQGVGAALIKTLFSWFFGRGEGGIWLEVRAGNEAAISLYKKHGFLEAGRRKNYYQNPVEDAVVFVYH